MKVSRSYRLVPIQITCFGGALAVAAFTVGADHWRLAPLLVIAAFAVGSELLATRVGVGTVWVSGGLLSIVLAATLNGPGPAAALAVIVIAAGWVHSREPTGVFSNNMLNGIWSALLAGLSFHGLVAATGAGVSDPVYYLLVLLAFVIAMLLNLLWVAVYDAGRAGPGAVVRWATAALKPVLAAQLFSALLTVAAVWVELHLHLAGLAMLGFVLAVFQYLVSELLTSKQRGDRLQRIATTDELTGLGNREAFRLAVESRIATAERFCVLLLDLDRFKEINDTLGHLYGDRLLQDLGPRLQDTVGERGTVSRLGGDEFGILPGEDADDAATIEAAVARLLRAVATPFSVDELSLEVGGSIGVARFPDDGEDSHALLRCADIAMYAAKEAQTDYKLYAAEQNRHSVRRLNVLSDLRRALAADEIIVHYQPIVDLVRRSVSGAEGLVRWQHPEHGLIPPGGFVQTVEQSGLIGPLTRHVLEHAIAQCASWRAAGRDMTVAVNLSVRNLLDRDLPREIERMLDHHRVPADALQLEITESMIMSDPERALATVSRLSDLGITLSVDDFGTGYSSLANLRRLPIDELKIDRSFVSPMLQDESDLIIVRSTINLGHDLGLRIIAEGVEDGATLERLATLGCDSAQGYHLSRPMDAGAFNRWLADTPRAAPPAPQRVPDMRPLPGDWTRTTTGLVVAAPEP